MGAPHHSEVPVFSGEDALLWALGSTGCAKTTGIQGEDALAEKGGGRRSPEKCRFLGKNAVGYGF